MKYFIPLFILMCLVPCLGLAQNSVTVNQQGSSNSVRVNQAGDDGKVPCPGAYQSTQKNEISIKGSEADSTIVSRGKKVNLLTVTIENNRINAEQNGKNNGMYIFLPDGNKKPATFSPHQKDSTTFISTLLSNVTLSQVGRDNSIVINPCAHKTDSANKVDVKQSGDGNSVNISQN